MSTDKTQDPDYDPDKKTLYDPRTGKAYPVQQMPTGLRLGKPVKK